ncbi:MAG: Fe-S cluster assembly protein SufD [Chloroflexota bacterium]|nr:MAG: Fe-S cluster assembly protein SufD [Chloroflexota bacterium]
MITRQTIDELSTCLNQPEWLRARRHAAFDLYERLPMPTRADEDYRRSDIRRLSLDQYAPVAVSTKMARSPRSLPPAARALFGGASKRGGADGGDLVQIDGSPAYAHLADDLAAKGVIFCSLCEAIQKHPELVRPWLEDERVGKAEDKWSALNGAMWSGGSFLYVPSGVEAALPLRAAFIHATPEAALFSRSLVIADDWSNVTYIDDYLSTAAPDAPGFNASVVDVIAKEGAAVRYCNLQNWGTGVWNFSRERFFGKRDSSINILQVALGSRFTKAYVHAHLDEPGVNAELLGLVFAGGNQHIDHGTLQDHIVGQTLSDLLFKVALTDDARSVYSGLIAIHPNAQRSDAYQNNRNLLLSDTARADSIPMLEILANDVRCTHGSTTSSVDEEEVFYLQSRGLPRVQAERLIVDGFFASVLERIPLLSVRDRLAHAIGEKVASIGLAA